MTSNIIKEADFVTGFLNQIKDETNFKEHPFETIFGVLGTALSFRFGLLIGGFISAAEIFGYGPGRIGAIIDDYFKNQGADSVHEINFSPSSIRGAADHVEKTLSNVMDFDKIKSIYSSNLNDIKSIKGSVTENDKKTALYVTASSLGINKTAAKSGLFRFLKLWKGGRRMGLISSIVMKLIWFFAKGLMALGIAGGVASMLGLKTKHDEEKAKEQTKPEEGEAKSSLQYYSNVSRDVKQTLIKFLNASIANFENGFMRAQTISDPSRPAISLENAPAWHEILSEIEKYNWMPISKINKLSAFVAPKIEDIAKTLLKSANVAGVKLKRLKSEPLSVKTKSKIPQNSGVTTPSELIKLLS